MRTQAQNRRVNGPALTNVKPAPRPQRGVTAPAPKADISPTTAELIALIRQQQDTIAKLQASPPVAKATYDLTYSVSPKGCVAVDGFWKGGGKAIYLYRNQWQWLIDHIDDLKAFMDANASTIRDHSK